MVPSLRTSSIVARRGIRPPAVVGYKKLKEVERGRVDEVALRHISRHDRDAVVRHRWKDEATRAQGYLSDGLDGLCRLPVVAVLSALSQGARASRRTKGGVLWLLRGCLLQDISGSWMLGAAGREDTRKVPLTGRQMSKHPPPPKTGFKGRLSVLRGKLDATTALLDDGDTQYLGTPSANKAILTPPLDPVHM